MQLRFVIFAVVMLAAIVGMNVYLYRHAVKVVVSHPKLRLAIGTAMGLLGLLAVFTRMLRMFAGDRAQVVIALVAWTWFGLSGYLFGTLALSRLGVSVFDRLQRRGAKRTQRAGSSASTTHAGPAPLTGRSNEHELAPLGASPSQRPASPFDSSPSRQPASPPVASPDAHPSHRLAEPGFVDLRPELASPERRKFLAQVAVGTAAVASGSLVSYGSWRAFHAPEVSELAIKLPGLPKALDGFTIVQVSDIHIGGILQRKFLAELVSRMNALKPDLIAITGDLVDGDVERLGPSVSALTDCRAKYGSWFCTGNHDFYSGADEWVEAIGKMGIRSLRNARVSIGDSRGSFDLVGVDDFGHGGRRYGPGQGYDLEKALHGRDPDRASVLLAHQPANFDVAAAKGIGLQLSGHTHAGQAFPITVAASFAWPWYRGLYREGNGQIYVNRGAGFWGPPLRIGSPPEIAKITLVA